MYTTDMYRIAEYLQLASIIVEVTNANQLFKSGCEIDNAQIASELFCSVANIMQSPVFYIPAWRRLELSVPKGTCSKFALTTEGGGADPVQQHVLGNPREG